MEYAPLSHRAAVRNRAELLFGGVRLEGGRLSEVFENNLRFLDRFDVDRMLYWFRVQAGQEAPGAPYGFDGGHFENNLYGQTAGQFLMGAGTALLWREHPSLRRKLDAVVEGIEACRAPDGYLIPLPRERFATKEYPNYVRAWLTFGLLAAGYAGNARAFALARDMGDWFNRCDCLPYVKDLNLGFQGILANAALYLSPVGVPRDLEVAQQHYREDWWLRWLKEGEQRAIYQHPGNHPHGTLLTSLEGYLDLYRATGEDFLLDCVRSALSMYEAAWQHVGGGIVMCEFDDFYPGCNFLSQSHAYNELCCSTFWALLNQRMMLLEPGNEHYAGEVEKTVYHLLAAAQVEDRGIHYLAYLEGSKDSRYTDVATCCAATGARLMAMLPQLLYSHQGDRIYVNLYESSRAQIQDAVLLVDTDMPYGGRVHLRVECAPRPLSLWLRVPAWCPAPLTVNGRTAHPGSYLALEGVRAGDEFHFELPFGFRSTLYRGAEEIPGKQRYAFEWGPLLLAAAGRGGVSVTLDPEHPDAWLMPIPGRRFKLRGSKCQEFIPYMDITDEPLTVYPVVERPGPDPA